MSALPVAGDFQSHYQSKAGWLEEGQGGGWGQKRRGEDSECGFGGGI